MRCMRKSVQFTLGAVLAAGLVAPIGGSSHREAPLISEDPLADNTDVYAFVSPDQPDTVTLIANWIPLEEPAGGPELLQVRRRRPLRDQDRQQRRRASTTSSTSSGSRPRSRTRTRSCTTPGPITSLDDANFNIRQTYTVAGSQRGMRTVLGSGLTTPPVNIGPRSTPEYDGAGCRQPSTRLPDGTKVFAGQRDDPFFVDLGSVFDLLGPASVQHGAR